MKPYVILLGFLGFTLPLMPVQQALIWFWPRAARRFPHWYHRQLCRIIGIRVHIVGELPQRGPAPSLANHVSWMDIVVLGAVLPCSFVAKSEVARWPLFGSLARLQRTVFVERQRRHRTAHSRDEIGNRLKAGDCVVLFPEGTSGNGETVQPFRSSYLAAAEGPDIPVMPVSLAYSRIRDIPLSKRDRPFFAWYGDMDLAPHLVTAVRHGPLTVTVVFHPALPVADRKSRARTAEAQVRKGLIEALHGRLEKR